MKTLIIIFALFLFLPACSTQKVDSQKAEVRKPKIEERAKNYVLVELFTSESCSSCPPADKVLAHLQNEQPVADAEIVPLALHVDYWNYLGWRDEFSSHAYSQRQNGYAERFKLDSIYTPQMVVDGQTQFVGSNLTTATDAVKEAAGTKKASVKILVENDEVKVNVGDLPAHDDAFVWLAVSEGNLQTEVRRGENSGKKLAHAAVAREMKLLGSVAAGEKDFTATQPLVLQPHWSRKNLSLVVFVQGQNSKSVFGVGVNRLA